MNRPLAFAALSAALLLSHPPRASAKNSFEEADLVSDVPGRAAQVDPHLVNPWGIVRGPHGQLRVVDNGAGVSTLYSANGTSGVPVIVVPPAGEGNPTGVVRNRTRSGFMVSKVETSRRSRLIFASEDGSISAWNPQVDSTNAITVATTEGAIYKGVALARNEDGAFLFATNFHAGVVDVFDGHFAPVSWPGAFTDPDLPDGFAPFNIANVMGRILVTYAKQDAEKHDDLHGPGLGYLDEYDRRGHLLRRLVSQGPLNAPWGLALAPGDFGEFSHTLLVGNFGDGEINAFDPATGKFLGHLDDASGNPISIEGLWGLRFAPGPKNDGELDSDLEAESDSLSDSDALSESDADESPTLYFTAGIDDEAHGLFGSLRPTHEEADRDDRHRRGDDDADLRVTMVGANPAHLSSSGIEFQVTTVAPEAVRIRIYDATGRLVAEPVNGLPVTGTAMASWDGLDLRGSKAPTGIYYYEAVAGNHLARGRVMVLR
jgi:uncharacterized protein (TIGR03118 family)